MSLKRVRTLGLPARTIVLKHAIEQLPQPIMLTGCDGTFEYVNLAFEILSGYSRDELLGQPASILKSGHHDAEFFRRLWTTILEGNVFRGVFVNRRRDSTLFRQFLSISPLIGERGRIVGFMAVGEDVATARYMRVEFLRQLRAIRDFAALFPGAVYRVNLARKTGLQFLNRYPAIEPMEATAGLDEGFAAYALLKPEDAQERRRLMDEAINSNKPFSCEYTIKEANGETRHYLECGMPLLDFEGKPSRIYGVIIDATQRTLLQESLRQSESTVRAVSAKLLTLQESERKRIARELHDGIGQILTSIKMQVEAASVAISQGGFPAGAIALQSIVPTIQDAMQEVRNMSSDLRPSILDDLGIIATIAWFSRNFSRAFEAIRVELDLRVAESNVPAPLKTIIYRVIQEAMNNVAKHSDANLVWIRLRHATAGLELIVEDNGHGFDWEPILAKPHGGIGLASMRERVRMSGGEFWIQSTPRIGTLIRASWPRAQATSNTQR